jgi:hypothetical protein
MRPEVSHQSGGIVAGFAPRGDGELAFWPSYDV